MPRQARFFMACGHASSDKLIGEDSENPPDTVIATLEAHPYYARIVKLFIPLQYSANLYALYLASCGDSTQRMIVCLWYVIGCTE